MQTVLWSVRAVTIGAAVATLLACGSGGSSVGTFDNTGGPPPTGTSIAFEPVSFALDPFCSSQLAAGNAALPAAGNSAPPATGNGAPISPPPQLALLARTEADIPVIYENEACSASLRTALAPSLASLSADQAIAIFRLAYGGCINEHEIAGVTRDNFVVHPWIVLLDASYGASNPGPCTTQLSFLGLIALRLNGVTGANAVYVVTRTANPNFPREPNVPNF